MKQDLTMKPSLKEFCLWVVLGSIFCLNLGMAIASESKDSPSFEKRLSIIEERTMMLHMVMKQLSHTYAKAKKDHDFMLKEGMALTDVQRLERAYQKKIQKMINDAVENIDHI